MTQVTTEAILAMLEDAAPPSQETETCLRR